MSGGKIVLLIFAAVGGVMILSIAACGGLLYWGFTSADEVAGPRVDAMFTAIDEGTFAETYDEQTTSEFQNRVSREEYAALGEAIREKLGRLQSKTMRSFNMQQHNSESMITATYSGNFAKATAEISVKMVKVADGWVFDAFDVNSPALPPEVTARTCPQCGAKQSASARFCAQCGADMSELPAEEMPAEEVPAEAPDPEIEAAGPALP